ncbi:unnamed protein product [Dicrocoelium dendriticum]|nr:unnamed protein product [Dicrocoelium dendriticum]
MSGHFRDVMSALKKDPIKYLAELYNRPQVEESVHKITLPPPREVSPLIRTARWSLLICGIVYGFTRLMYLRSREDAKQKEFKRIVKMRYEDHQRRYHEESEKTLRQLAQDCGVDSLD